ncbi:hypothetical protein E1B28_002543 [Marasmius oreades]|uniref:Uncharacterized protein n=1 Tax=Marasmius oreades TaxID=181124 RepID=A0A9P7ULJ8_9AGAR|nr:uncharacterized protein E1B28_002543 [Marasmius oreades]KAG7086598.1 hypothetical protein E1B28_002543 [Marasmius oreades]
MLINASDAQCLNLPHYCRQRSPNSPLQQTTYLRPSGLLAIDLLVTTSLPTSHYWGFFKIHRLYTSHAEVAENQLSAYDQGVQVYLPLQTTTTRCTSNSLT